MRLALAGQDRTRQRFVATFVCWGKTRTVYKRPTPTLLLHHVTCGGVVVAEHLWLTDVDAFRGLGLRGGDTVAFEAQVTGYWKGAGTREKDYGLCAPSHVRKVGT